MSTANAFVTPVRHRNVKGVEETYLKVANTKGKEELIEVGAGALKKIEEVLKDTEIMGQAKISQNEVGGKK